MATRRAPPLQWKRDAPTEGGFYYWQGGLLAGDQVDIVQISKYKNRSGFCAQRLGLGYQPGDRFSGDLEEMAPGWWAGPLPQPFA